jgi:hypothetical protein
MLFLILFATLLLIFFGLVDPWMKKRNIKPRYAKSLPLFDLVGGLIGFLKQIF